MSTLYETDSVTCLQNNHKNLLRNVAFLFTLEEEMI